MKPILFNTEMVRAILEDRKTVTRRVVKPQPANVMTEDELRYRALSGADPYGFYVGTLDTELLKNAPYHPSDILYVRETWCQGEDGYSYRADYDTKGYAPYIFKWHPSIHMPREASRIFLRVTDVRVERLKDITPEEATNEGVGKLFLDEIAYGAKDYGNPIDEEFGVSKEQFASLWDSTIKSDDLALYGWEANPWAWVIEFERISREEAESCRSQ